ncbi:MAG: S41 family peptidase [Rickettsiales bacterium]
MFFFKILSRISIILLITTTQVQAKIDKTTINKFESILNKIEELHIENLNDQDITLNAINGVLKEMDPHSNLMNRDDYQDLMENTEGEFGGIGVEIQYKKDIGFLVITAIDDLPAYNAGIKNNDMIIAVDDKLLSDLSQTKGIKKMRGKPGTNVKITVKRTYDNESSKILSFNVIRDVIKTHPIKYLIEDEIVYIRIPAFDKNTFVEFYDIVSRLKENNIKGILMDLRSNPGGILEGSIKISDLLIEKGTIVSTKGKSAMQKKEYRANPSPNKILDLPLVVLVDKYSASAAEIVAAAIQDHKRGLIVGENTFGKGSVQSVFDLNKDYAIKITTALHYRPNGETIQAKGIKPDIIIPYEKSEQEKQEEVNQKEDLSIKINEANYNSSIKPENKKDNIKEDKEKNKDNETKEENKDNETKEENKDNQIKNNIENIIQKQDVIKIDTKDNIENNNKQESVKIETKSKKFNLIASQTNREKLSNYINNNQYQRAKDILKGLIIIQNNSNNN